MARNRFGSAAIALGALLAAGGLADAQDTVRLGGSGARPGNEGVVLNLAGQGTVADAAVARDDDTELTGGCRRYYGAYYGGGYCYGGSCGVYRGYYGGGCGYRPVYTGYYGGGCGYRPVYTGYYGGYYGGGCGYRPVYTGYYGGYYGGGCGYGRGFYAGFRINGTAVDVNMPALALGAAPRQAPTFEPEPIQAPVFQPVLPPPPPYQPAPAVNPQPSPAPVPTPAVDIPVSLKRSEPGKPAYTFKAYGEK